MYIYKCLLHLLRDHLRMAEMKPCPVWHPVGWRVCTERMCSHTRELYLGIHAVITGGHVL